jgi:SNF2 family DNA or RNA helicase
LTVGSVQYDPSAHAWVIRCEPHVSMRLKRVFGKLGKHSVGRHVISDTAENARDLEWFLERYPMQLSDETLLRGRAAEHKERSAIVEALLANRADVQQFDLAIPAREYQRVAAAILLARGGLLLGDDVGIGKTVSAICTFCDPRTLPAVVVTLTHLPRQWQAEIARFAPNLTVHIVKRGQPYDLTDRRSRGNQLSFPSAFPDVVILNYHKLSGWSETLAKVCRSVVFDECQELRKTGSAKYAAAEHLAHSMQFRLGLSATPIYNYGGEIHSVLSCLCLGELGTIDEFCTEWCAGNWGDKTKIKNPKVFGSYLRSSGLMLRRTRADVGRELPDVQVVPHYVESDTEALDRVSRSCAELAKLILSQAQLDRGVKMRASEELSNTLRQATGIAKAPYVADFVRLLLESGEKIVLYGWHREVYSIWADRLQEFKPAFYTGEESVPQKEESKRRFIAGETNLLIVSLRSGAGMDGLQKVCRTVVFGELDWSPGVHEQCIGRVHRDGQTDPVVVYYLLAEDGADPIMAEVLGVKRQQIEGICKNPNEEVLIEKLQSDGGHLCRLAEAYLANRGAA